MPETWGIQLNPIKPELVVFDLDGTLYDYESANREATSYLANVICSTTNFNNRQVARAIEKARSNVKSRLGDTGASHSRILYINEALRILDINPRASWVLSLEQSFWNKFFEHMSPLEGVQELIVLLRSANIEIALLTDLTLQVQLRKLIRLNLDSEFDSIFSSEELGGDKKTGIPFEIIRSIYSTKKHIWYVGDGENDYDHFATNATFYRVGQIAKFRGPRRNFIDFNFIISDFKKSLGNNSTVK